MGALIRLQQQDDDAERTSPAEILTRLVKTVAAVVEVASPDGTVLVPVLAVTSGHMVVDHDRVLAAVKASYLDRGLGGDLDLSAATIRKATFSECSSVFGYEAGRIAPFAKATSTHQGDSTTLGATVLVDTALASLSDDGTVYCGVGLADVLLRVSPPQLVAMSGGTVASFSTGPDTAHKPAQTAGASSSHRRSGDPSPAASGGHGGCSGGGNGEGATSHDRARQALEEVAMVDKAGWGRRHIKFTALAITHADGEGSTRGSSNPSPGTAAAAGGDPSGDADGGHGGASCSVECGADNAEVLVEVARMLADQGMHQCAVLQNMLQAHMGLLYGPGASLPAAPRVVTDFLARTQPFLCNGMGNFTLRVLSFVAYVLRCAGGCAQAWFVFD